MTQIAAILATMTVKTLGAGKGLNPSAGAGPDFAAVVAGLTADAGVPTEDALAVTPDGAGANAGQDPMTDDDDQAPPGEAVVQDLALTAAAQSAMADLVVTPPVLGAAAPVAAPQARGAADAIALDRMTRPRPSWRMATAERVPLAPTAARPLAAATRMDGEAAVAQRDGSPQATPDATPASRGAAPVEIAATMPPARARADVSPRFVHGDLESPVPQTSPETMPGSASEAVTASRQAEAAPATDLLRRIAAETPGSPTVRRAPPASSDTAKPDAAPMAGALASVPSVPAAAVGETSVDPAVPAAATPLPVIAVPQGAAETLRPGQPAVSRTVATVEQGQAGAVLHTTAAEVALAPAERAQTMAVPPSDGSSAPSGAPHIADRFGSRSAAVAPESRAALRGAGGVPVEPTTAAPPAVATPDATAPASRTALRGPGDVPVAPATGASEAMATQTVATPDVVTRPAAPAALVDGSATAPRVPAAQSGAPSDRIVEPQARSPQIAAPTTDLSAVEPRESGVRPLAQPSPARGSQSLPVERSQATLPVPTIADTPAAPAASVAVPAAMPRAASIAARPPAMAAEAVDPAVTAATLSAILSMGRETSPLSGATVSTPAPNPTQASSPVIDTQRPAVAPGETIAMPADTVLRPVMSALHRAAPAAAVADPLAAPPVAPFAAAELPARRQSADTGADTSQPVSAAASAESAAVAAPTRSYADIVQSLPPIAQAAIGPVGDTATLTASRPDVGAVLENRVIDMSVGGQWIDRVAKEITQLAEGTGHSRFQLSPPNLGRIQIDIRQGEGGSGSHVQMLTETSEAAQRLRDGQSSLQADARLAALSFGSIAITHVAGAFEMGSDRSADRDARQQQQTSDPAQQAFSQGNQQNGQQGGQGNQPGTQQQQPTQPGGHTASGGQLGQNGGQNPSQQGQQAAQDGNSNGQGKSSLRRDVLGHGAGSATQEGTSARRDGDRLVRYA